MSEPIDEIRAIDDANAPDRLCVVCRASEPADGQLLCASCAYQGEGDDRGESEHIDHGHAA